MSATPIEISVGGSRTATEWDGCSIKAPSLATSSFKPWLPLEVLVSPDGEDVALRSLAS